MKTLMNPLLFQNFLNNFQQDYAPVVVGRFLMLLQLFTIFPLVMYIMRTVTLQMISDRPEQLAHYRYAFYGINVLGLLVFVFLTIFLPNISIVIRYAGGVCGFVLIFAGPVSCHWAYMAKYDRIRIPVMVAEAVALVLGFSNMVAQFVVAP